VATLSSAIAREMGLSAEIIHSISLAASIHDLGKIRIPAEILSKPGTLNPIEYQLVMGHPQTGYDIIKDIQFSLPIAQMVLQHHERLDGSGYPQGLKDGQILLEAKILAVADVVEAMLSHRPYRPGLGADAALEEILKHRGAYYDPVVVDSCIALFREKKFDFDPR
jgi:HD-GYP domain-containing protein (c-di-GMP phosphodiesterase class II)